MTDGRVVLTIDLTAPGWPAALRDAAAENLPLVLSAHGRCPAESLRTEHLSALLYRPMPVTGVLSGSVGGPAGVALLACDEVFWCPRARLRLEPSGGGEVTLLSARMGPAAAGRVWFSGGVLTRREAVRSGWAVGAPEHARGLELARRRHTGLSRSALSLLRELLYREIGLPLDAAQALERAAFAAAFASGDPAEGIAAFLEKRRALFAPNRS